MNEDDVYAGTVSERKEIQRNIQVKDVTGETQQVDRVQKVDTSGEKRTVGSTVSIASQDSTEIHLPSKTTKNICGHVDSLELAENRVDSWVGTAEDTDLLMNTLEKVTSVNSEEIL